MDSARVPTAPIPTVAITSKVQTPSPIVFPTGPRDALLLSQLRLSLSSSLHCPTGIYVIVLAKLAYDTLQVFGQREMFVVDSALYILECCGTTHSDLFHPQ